MSMSCGCISPAPSGPTLASTCGGSSFIAFMGILDVFIRQQCDLEDACGRANARFRSEPDRVYDFIVVGGGSAGPVVASRLSENPNWKVLLIEAGDDEPTGTQIPSMFFNYVGSEIDWNITTEPETQACLSSKDRRCKWPRGKVLGGTSVLYGMMYMRGNREDYDYWASLGNPGWSYNDVMPYFLKSENNLETKEFGTMYHGTDGLMPVGRFPYNPPMSYSILKGGEEMGFKVHDLNGPNSTGFAIAQTISKNGVRMSSARAFLRPARLRPNLHILLNTTVTRVLVNPYTKITKGVEIIDQNGKTRKIFVEIEVIVSAGAVHSPHILLLSGIGPKNDIKQVNIQPVHDLPGVGKNLHNHVSFLINFFIDEPDNAPLNWKTAMDYLINRNGLMSGTGITDVTAKIVTKYADGPNIPDLQLFFNGYRADCSKTGEVHERLSNNSRLIQIVPLSVNAKSRGYLTLHSNDPLKPPKIIANYLADKRDVELLIEGIKISIRLSETNALKAYGMRLDKTPIKGCENIEFGTDEYWECAVRHETGPENHQAGSCKMGPAEDPYAVVDPQLRVYGVQGLRVVDASIMPKVVNGNPYATIVMIAEKASDIIRRYYESQVQYKIV